MKIRIRFLSMYNETVFDKTIDMGIEGRFIIDLEDLARKMPKGLRLVITSEDN